MKPNADYIDGLAIAAVIIHHDGKTLHRSPAEWDIIGVLDTWARVPGASVMIVWG